MIILECITEKNKLRIRFNSFIDEEGKVFTNVYNNLYNCQFPKNIRENGKFYEKKLTLFISHKRYCIIFHLINLKKMHNVF